MGSLVWDGLVPVAMIALLGGMVGGFVLIPFRLGSLGLVLGLVLGTGVGFVVVSGGDPDHKGKRIRELEERVEELESDT